MKEPRFRPHHLGIAVDELDTAIRFYTESLDFDLLSGPFDDPVQKVSVCFIGSADSGRIELVAPLDKESPVNRYLTKEIGAYHICYEVSDLNQAVQDLAAQGCLSLGQPVPAVAFAGRRIAWLFTPTRHLLELLETDRSG